MKNYDAIIIGSGGWTKLRPLADMWKKIAVIEKDKLGWTCLNRGCIPSKMFIHLADIIQEMKEAKNVLEMDFDDSSIKVDFEKLSERVNKEISWDSESVKKMYENHENIDLYMWAWKFVSNKVVEVNWEQMTAPHIFIATGSRPMIPQIEGLEGTPYMTSTEALQNKKLPKSLIVIWGWYIATELWHFYWWVGSKVKFLVRSEMLRAEDKEIREEFTKAFSNLYDVEMWITPTKVEYKNWEFIVYAKDKFSEEKIYKSEWLLVSTWIKPNSDTISIENTDIKTNSKWFIEVDNYLETSVSWVYALWDIVGNYLFRHSVNFEWEYLLDNLFLANHKKEIEYSPVPHAVFTYPQVAWVWKTEDELIRDWVEYVVWKNNYRASAMWSALRSESGFVKLLFDKKTKKLLWAHIIGAEASNMIHILIAYITMNAGLDELLNMIYIHPALPEIVRNAARKARTNFEK